MRIALSTRKLVTSDFFFIVIPTSSPEMSFSFLASRKGVGLLKTSLRLLIPRNHHHSKASPYIWEKPRTGWMKLNFDGASKCGISNHASIGGVCRDHEGLFKLGYAERIGQATSSVAELAACKRGLELALQNGWLNIWIEGDAKVVMDFLANNAKLKSQDDLRIVKEISLLIPQLSEFHATHIYRRGNKVAHRFAKLGYKYRKPQIWRDVPPIEVARFLQHDVAGCN
ncbi:hypothetical protein Cni_G24466 [Canna indica]|uniref:RNase H type-1 domain-containing protein n=1 Tax=Canna indica TaxID=4628 RepID=A0AAQ3KW05_9LILI|nr:hypothetical protein Cni_G24466 [Canna indica]